MSTDEKFATESTAGTGTDIYKRTLVFCWTCWIITIILVGLRAVTLIPAQFSFVALLTVGAGIASSLSLSRMRLSGAITQVFNTGLSVAVSLSANNAPGAAHTAVFRTDLDGVIKSAEHAEVVGWESETDLLVGRSMDSLIPDRFLRINHAALKSYREASAEGTDEAGVVIGFNVPIRGYDGVERAFRMTIARLGDTLVKTLVPISDTLPTALD